MLELFGAVVAFLLIVGTLLLTVRGLFARETTQALKRVRQQEESLQAKADLLEQRLSQMEQDHRQKLKHAQGEAERVVQEAKQQAMNIRTAAVEEAKHRARQLLLEAEQGKLQLKAEVAKELDGRAVQHACASLRTLLPAPALVALHEALVGELLTALNGLDAAALRGHLERVVVVTGQPFAEADAKRLAQWAETALGRGTAVEMNTEPTLLAGCVVQLGTTVVDNSLPNRLSRS
jgi:F0F1-type ATP synthase membrane subunit b/b'